MLTFRISIPSDQPKLIHELDINITPELLEALAAEFNNTKNIKNILKSCDPSFDDPKLSDIQINAARDQLLEHYLKSGQATFQFLFNLSSTPEGSRYLLEQIKLTYLNIGLRPEEVQIQALTSQFNPTKNPEVSKRLYAIHCIVIARILARNLSAMAEEILGNQTEVVTQLRQIPGLSEDLNYFESKTASKHLTDLDILHINEGNFTIYDKDSKEDRAHQSKISNQLSRMMHSSNSDIINRSFLFSRFYISVSQVIQLLINPEAAEEALQTGKHTISTVQLQPDYFIGDNALLNQKWKATYKAQTLPLLLLIEADLKQLAILCDTSYEAISSPGDQPTQPPIRIPIPVTIPVSISEKMDQDKMLEWCNKAQILDQRQRRTDTTLPAAVFPKSKKTIRHDPAQNSFFVPMGKTSRKDITPGLRIKKNEIVVLSTTETVDALLWSAALMAAAMEAKQANIDHVPPFYRNTLCGYLDKFNIRPLENGKPYIWERKPSSKIVPVVPVVEAAHVTVAPSH